MDNDVIDLLNQHEYFRGLSGAILQKIASFAKVTNYDTVAIIHQPNHPLIVGLVRPFAMLLPGWLLLRQGNRSRRYDISG
jgi:hypothetical protein